MGLFQKPRGLKFLAVQRLRDMLWFEDSSVGWSSKGADKSHSKWCFSKTDVMPLCTLPGCKAASVTLSVF